MHGYPRPQLRRERWLSLNGTWQFAFDPEPGWDYPDEVSWDLAIEVPFSPEAPASGLGRTDLFSGCWYRRTFEAAGRVVYHCKVGNHCTGSGQIGVIEVMD